MTTGSRHQYSIRATVFLGYDVTLTKRIAHCGQEERLVLMSQPPTIWGELPAVSIVSSATQPATDSIELDWQSDKEQANYEATIDLRPYLQTQEELLQKRDDEGQPLYSYLLVGIAPRGSVSVWLAGTTRSVLLCHIMVRPAQANLSDSAAVPKRMVQFSYRYLIIFGYWDEDEKAWHKEEGDAQSEQKEKEVLKHELIFLAEALVDGTHDKLNDGRLLHYHEAGRPKKLAVHWQLGKKEWSAYLWFDDEETLRVFDHFYGAHPETKTDLILRIDPEKDHYELSIYRQGLREPQVIHEKVYQLLVFRNKFECFRSDNYKQESGAWIW